MDPNNKEKKDGPRLIFNKADLMPSTTTDMDVYTVLFCASCNMCMLRNDLDKKGHCKKCGKEVIDITDSPLAESWRQIVHAKPKRRSLWPSLIFLPIFLAPTGRDLATGWIVILVGILVAIILFVSFTRRKE